ncbi:MAG: ABC transporter ATP-binding protein [Candidatus Beckwithbacteria bacterium]|nr:ABC transporter ATP-binding protein [Candidatus Beckwithbacteria bacterium]
MGKVVLEVKNLTKVFGGRKRPTVAVDHISFKINEGEIVGFLGPNGAGKTTTIQMLLGTTSKTSGQIKYFGKEFEKNRSEIMQQVNYASAYIRLPWRMTVWENLMVYAKMYGVKNPRERVKLVLELFRMSKYTNKGFNTLSSGQITRVMLAKAMINFPKLLLLDEPTASLDPEVADKVRKFLLRQQEKYNVSILFTSHNMAEVTEVCDRVIFLRKGKIVAEDTPKGLARRIKICTLRYRVGDKETEVKINEEEIASFLNDLAKREIKYDEISIDKPTLEDFFLSQL